VAGEDLPHVTHYFTEGHYAFQQEAVVVGGGNSAVDAALDLYRAGARVTMVHFGPGLDPNVKPWVMPDIAARIREGKIAARWHSRVTAIDAEAVTIRAAAEGDPADAGAAARGERLPADHVFLATGFMPNTALLEQLGVPLAPETGVPAHDPETMESAVPGVFIAGVIASGFNANRIFIENGRDHGDLIVRRLATT
jgi:thioredoxin reductase (NADPH)